MHNMKIDIQPGQKLTLVTEDMIITAEVGMIRSRIGESEEERSGLRSLFQIPIRIVKSMVKGNG